MPTIPYTTGKERKNGTPLKITRAKATTHRLFVNVSMVANARIRVVSTKDTLRVVFSLPKNATKRPALKVNQTPIASQSPTTSALTPGLSPKLTFKYSGINPENTKYKHCRKTVLNCGTTNDLLNLR